jgi:DNA-binding transcriptional LysR family regulator
VEWQQIIGFYHVAKTGSFTKAAESTFRTQSALTQQIKALETEMGCQLFERVGKRKLLLTLPGEKFLLFCETVLMKHEFLLDELNEIKRLKKGSLRLAAPFSTLYYLLPETLKIYRKRFPWVELSLFDQSQQNVINLVRDGDVDFGIMYESMAPQDFSKIRWLKVETALIAPLGHPLALKNQVNTQDIAQFTLILPPKSEYIVRKRLEELFQKDNLEYQIIMESSNIELSFLYVEMGLGISFATIVRNMPTLVQKKLEFIFLSHYFEPDFITIVMRKEKVLSSYKSGFLNILFNQATDQSLQWRESL